MKTSHFRSVVIASVTAVFAGVVLLGTNAALGDSPTYNPPGGNISPTFEGLKVKNGGVTGEYNGFQVLRVLGAVFSDGLKIRDGYHMSFETKGDITNVRTIWSDKVVAGESTVSTILYLGGTLKNLVSGPVQVDDDLKVTGQIDVAGILTNAAHLLKVDGSIEMSGALVNAGIEPVKVNDDLSAMKNVNVWGDLTVQKKISNGIYDDLELGSGLSNTAVVKVNDNLNVIGTINAGGKITGNSIGTYTRRYATMNVLPSDAMNLYVPCLTGETAISCGYSGWPNVNVYINRIDSTLGGCNIYANNSYTVARSVTGYAMCFNPKL